jgi:hypothetical protein
LTLQVQKTMPKRARRHIIRSFTFFCLTASNFLTAL